MVPVSIDQIRLDAEFRAFKAALDKIAKATGNDTGKILWKYSSQFAAQLVSKTTPRGTGNRPQKIGQAAVARDIDKVYANAGRIYSRIREESQEVADMFWAAWTEGDTNNTIIAMRLAGKVVSSIPVIAFDGGRAHKAARRTRGRVRAEMAQAYLVEKGSSHKVRQYIQEIKSNVGYTKSGWINGFHPPSGVRGIPHWVKNRDLAPGRVVDKTRSGMTRSIDFENHVRWISDNFNPRAAMASLSWVRKRIEADIEKSVVDNVRRA